MEGLAIALIFLCLMGFGAVKDYRYDKKIKDLRSSIEIHRQVEVKKIQKRKHIHH